MSVKHVKEEYLRICNDYKDMLDTLHDLEDAMAENMISEEKFEQLKAPIEKMKENYMRWSYIMFLLDRPNKKKKQARYAKQKKFDYKEIDHEENRQCLDELKSNIDSI